MSSVVTEGLPLIPTRPQTHRPRHAASVQAANAADRLTAHQRGYGFKWRRARLAFLSDNPLCVICQAEGRIEPATVVDHITPHKGDEERFWDRGNWRALCAYHHNQATALYDGAFGREVRPKPKGEGQHA